MSDILYFFVSEAINSTSHPEAQDLAKKVLKGVETDKGSAMDNFHLIGHVSFTDTPPSADCKDREVDIAFVESYYEGKGLMQAMIRYLVAFIASRCRAESAASAPQTCRTTRRTVRIKPTPFSVVFKLEDMTDLMCEQNMSNLSTVRSVYHSVGFEFSSNDSEMELRVHIDPVSTSRDGVATNTGQPYFRHENTRMENIDLQVVHVFLDSNQQRVVQVLPPQFGDFVNYKTVCIRRAQGGRHEASEERIVYKGNSYKLHHEGRRRFINCKKEDRKLYLTEIKAWQRQSRKTI
jgi:hypothetical protein